MKKLLVRLAMLLLVTGSFEQLCLAGCQFDLTISNTSTMPITVTKVSTAVLGTPVAVSRPEHQRSFAVGPRRARRSPAQNPRAFTISP